MHVSSRVEYISTLWGRLMIFLPERASEETMFGVLKISLRWYGRLDEPRFRSIRSIPRRIHYMWPNS